MADQSQNDTFETRYSVSVPVFDPSNLLKAEDFEPYINQTFRILANIVDPLPCSLIEVSRGAIQSQEAGQTFYRQPFSVVFRGPADDPVPQQLYLVEHDEMGRIELFLVPIGPDDEGLRYEAVFG